MKIRDIVIGTRHRQDLGDVDGLAESIRQVGLLHPVVVNDAGELIAGERRLAAVKLLGRSEIDATIARTLSDIHKALMAERDENRCRKDFTPSEATAMAKALEPYEKTAAAERKASGNTERVNFTPSAKGKAADKVAEAVGMSRPTLAKATAVVEAAQSHPEAYADIQQEMDRSGKVAPAYDRLAARAAAPAAPKVDLPHKPSRTPPRFSIPDDEATFGEDGEELPPVPDGPTPAEIAKKDPTIILTRLLHDVCGSVNSFLLNGTVDKLRRTTTPEKRKQFAGRINDLIAELEKLRKKLE